MDNAPLTKTISCIIAHENELDLVINELLEKTVARHDISIQGNSEHLKKKYGRSFVNPTFVQHAINPPKEAPFLHDDYGWLLGFAFATPVFICVIIGVFLIGDLNSSYDNLLYGFLGLLVGSIIGLKIYRHLIKKRRINIAKQENLGGFILWVFAHNTKQETMIIELLKEHHATNIEIHENQPKER